MPWKILLLTTPTLSEMPSLSLVTCFSANQAWIRIALPEVLSLIITGRSNFCANHWLIHWIKANHHQREQKSRGFPGGAVVENLPANAGDTGSSPGLGRSHMPRSNWAREPQLLRLRVWSLCSATRERLRQWEAHAPRWRVAPARCN